MSSDSKKSFPGGSKSRLNRAGEKVRAGTATDEDYDVIEQWRIAHRAVLNNIQANLRTRNRDKEILVGQRHKRKLTIFDKLKRLPRMDLSRMDDIVGCRLIFKDVSTLNKFRDDFHNARFLHKLRNDRDKYDYISKPKSSGYRGIHDVYEYKVNSKKSSELNGLLFEIQYRTLVQHAWATAVEIIGSITASQPKFQKGDERYEKIMVLASEILARAMEGIKGPLPELTDQNILDEFLKLDKDLGLQEMLRKLKAGDKTLVNEDEAENDSKNLILMFTSDRKLELKRYRYATDALRALFELEKEHPNSDIVFVRADSNKEIRLAYKNYFSDPSEFLRLLDESCKKLAKNKNVFDRNVAITIARRPVRTARRAESRKVKRIP